MTTLDLDGSGLLAIFLLALTCNVAFALHDSFFKKPSPEEVAMAVNIASLTVKAAEVRAPRGYHYGSRVRLWHVRRHRRTWH